MKKLLKYNSLLTISLVFLLFFAIPIALSFFLGYQTAGGYLSPLILLLLTWLLYKREGRNLTELGLNTKGRNIYFLPLGIIIGILFLAITLFAQMLNEEIKIEVNKNADYLIISGGVFFIIQGVLNEELIFRGYCFKKTVDRLGIRKTNLVFAFFFMVWHWISFNAWGNYQLMLGLITTAFGHFLFATALLRSGTLYFPIGLHLGVNWASRYLFYFGMKEQVNTKPANDVLFFISSTEQSPSTLHVITNYIITITCFLTLTWIIWKWRKKKLNPP